MDNPYTEEYIKEHMDDFRAFVKAVDESVDNKYISTTLLAILYISMKRVK
jgi:hypothetical protein